MAIFHLSVKTVSRSAGRSATAAAAYRAGAKIVDVRTGEIHDYTRKGGVLSSEIFCPYGSPAWAGDRAALWNAIEQAETRKNSTVAREFVIALPGELSDEERRRLAYDFAREIVDRHQCAAEVSIHEPSKGGDDRNYHAHILLSTRRLTREGFSEKTRELDYRKTGEVDYWRQRFADLQNERLLAVGSESRVDHRSLEAQGIDRTPSRHLGPAVTEMERRGVRTEVSWRIQQEASERLANAAELGGLEREAVEVKRAIIDTETDLQAALQERARRNAVRSPGGPRGGP